MQDELHYVSYHCIKISKRLKPDISILSKHYREQADSFYFRIKYRPANAHNQLSIDSSFGLGAVLSEFRNECDPLPIKTFAHRPE